MSKLQNTKSAKYSPIDTWWKNNETIKLIKLAYSYNSLNNCPKKNWIHDLTTGISFSRNSGDTELFFKKGEKFIYNQSSLLTYNVLKNSSKIHNLFFLKKKKQPVLNYRSRRFSKFKKTRLWEDRAYFRSIYSRRAKSARRGRAGGKRWADRRAYRSFRSLNCSYRPPRPPAGGGTGGAARVWWYAPASVSGFGFSPSRRSRGWPQPEAGYRPGFRAVSLAKHRLWRRPQSSVRPSSARRVAGGHHGTAGWRNHAGTRSGTGRLNRMREKHPVVNRHGQRPSPAGVKSRSSYLLQNSIAGGKPVGVDPQFFNSPHNSRNSRRFQSHSSRNNRQAGPRNNQRRSHQNREFGPASRPPRRGRIGGASRNDHNSVNLYLPAAHSRRRWVENHKPISGASVGGGSYGSRLVGPQGRKPTQPRYANHPSPNGQARWGGRAGSRSAPAFGRGPAPQGATGQGGYPHRGQTSLRERVRTRKLKLWCYPAQHKFSLYTKYPQARLVGMPRSRKSIQDKYRLLNHNYNWPLNPAKLSVHGTSGRNSETRITYWPRPKAGSPAAPTAAPTAREGSFMAPAAQDVSNIKKKQKILRYEIGRLIHGPLAYLHNLTWHNTLKSGAYGSVVWAQTRDRPDRGDARSWASNVIWQEVDSRIQRIKNIYKSINRILKRILSNSQWEKYNQDFLTYENFLLKSWFHMKREINPVKYFLISQFLNQLSKLDSGIAQSLRTLRRSQGWLRLKSRPLKKIEYKQGKFFFTKIKKWSRHLTPAKKPFLTSKERKIFPKILRKKKRFFLVIKKAGYRSLINKNRRLPLLPESDPSQADHAHRAQSVTNLSQTGPGAKRKIPMGYLIQFIKTFLETKNPHIQYSFDLRKIKYFSNNSEMTANWIDYKITKNPRRLKGPIYAELRRFKNISDKSKKKYLRDWIKENWLNRQYTNLKFHWEDSFSAGPVPRR